MADATAFNLQDNQKAERKLLVTCVKATVTHGRIEKHAQHLFTLREIVLIQDKPDPAIIE